MSVNTSLNSTVNFTCEVTGVNVTHFLANCTSAEDTDIENRGFYYDSTRHTLSVLAQAINNNTIISCVGEPGPIYSHNATLMIQGTLINYFFYLIVSLSQVN